MRAQAHRRRNGGRWTSVRPGWRVDKVRRDSTGTYADVLFAGKPVGKVGYIKRRATLGGWGPVRFKPYLYSRTIETREYPTEEQALDVIVREHIGGERFEGKRGRRNPADLRTPSGFGGPFATKQDAIRHWDAAGADRNTARGVVKVGRKWYHFDKHSGELDSEAAQRLGVREYVASVNEWADYYYKDWTGRERPRRNPGADPDASPFYTADRDFDTSDVPKVDEAWFKSKGKGWKSVGLSAARSAVDRLDGARLVKYSQKQATGRAKTVYAYQDDSKANPGVTDLMSAPWYLVHADGRIEPRAYQSEREAWSAAWRLPDSSVRVIQGTRAQLEREIERRYERIGNPRGKQRGRGAPLFGVRRRSGLFASGVRFRSATNARKIFIHDELSGANVYLPSGSLKLFKSLEAANAFADKLNSGQLDFYADRSGQLPEIRLGKRNERNGSRRKPNPEQPASALYESFHGKPSTGYTEVEETIHEHDWLSELGTLVSMKIRTPSKINATLTFHTDCKSKVILSSNEDGNQLYFVGGDQEVPLKDLQLDGSAWKRDTMLLGELREITYRTAKSMHKFKTTDYYHKAGEDTGVKPVLLYDRKSKLLSLAGGQYEVRPEGIVN